MHGISLSRRWIFTALVYTILLVAHGVSKKKVIPSATRRIVAMVAHHIYTWIKTVLNIETYPTRNEDILAYPEQAILFLISKCGPLPAWPKFWSMRWRRSIPAHFSPETINILLRWRRDWSKLFSSHLRSSRSLLVRLISARVTLLWAVLIL